MGRLFLTLVLLAVSLYVVKLIRQKLDKPPNRLKKDNSGEDSNKNKTDEKMVKCLHCGLHIPDKEAIKQGDKNFCSIDHARQHL